MNSAFLTIEEIIEKMLYSMEGNDDFLKLITITKRDALDLPTPVLNYKDLIGENLFPMERIALPNEEAKSIVAIDFLDMNRSRGSDEIYNVRFTVDVYTETSDTVWMLNGGKLRIPRLAQIVQDSILSIDSLPTLSEDAKFTECKSMYFDTDRKFKGVRMIFTWENFSGYGDNL